MDKLTLSVDRQVIRRAKAHARAQGTSVSRLVESLLDLAARPAGPHSKIGSGTTPPVLARLRGSISRGSVEDYRRHLERKYT